MCACTCRHAWLTRPLEVSARRHGSCIQGRCLLTITAWPALPPHQRCQHAHRHESTQAWGYPSTHVIFFCRNSPPPPYPIVAAYLEMVERLWDEVEGELLGTGPG